MSALTTEEFKQCLNNMRTHYKSDTESKYQLPDKVLSLASFNADELPKEAQEAQTNFKKDGVVFFKDNQDGCTKAAQQFETDKNQANFKQIMEARKQKAKADAALALDKLYDTMAAAGDAHPEQQSNILTITKGLSDFFHGNIVGGIINIVNALVSIIQNVVHQVQKFFTDMWGKVSGWFGSLFLPENLSFEKSAV